MAGCLLAAYPLGESAPWSAVAAPLGGGHGACACRVPVMSELPPPAPDVRLPTCVRVGMVALVGAVVLGGSVWAWAGLLCAVVAVVAGWRGRRVSGLGWVAVVGGAVVGVVLMPVVF